MVLGVGTLVGRSLNGEGAVSGFPVTDLFPGPRSPDV